MLKVACIGMAVADLIVGPLDKFEFEIDVTPIDNISVLPGGDASNVAINLSRLGVPVNLFAKLGNDMFGNWLARYYDNEGIDSSHIKFDNTHKTSTSVALVKQDAERVFLYHSGATGSLSLSDFDIEQVLSNDIIHCSGFYLLPQLETSGLPELFHTAKKQGKITSLDVGWDNSGQWLSKLKPMLPNLTYFLPTQNEAAMITGQDKIEDMASFLLDSGVENVIIKAGSQGAYVKNHQEEHWVSPFLVKNLVDTTGAGDGFVSGFLGAICNGLSLKDAVSVGNKVGSIIVQEYGALANTAALKSINLEEK